MFQKMKRFYSYEPETAAPASPPPLVVKIPAPICDYCQHSANKSGEHEELLFCKDCNAKAHPTCMEYSAVLAHRARMYPWQCIDCKTCNLCKDAGDADSMLFCDACDKGFHMNCHKPQVTEKPSGKWICFECSQQGIKTSDIDSSNPTENSSSVRLLTNGTQHTTALGLSTTAADLPITPCDSPVSELDHKSKRLAANSLPAVPSPSLPKLSSYTLEGAHYPDASSWSIEDVGSFFESIGFSDQADAFREQEIDGQSLLLMKRSDVLTGLSIKLGPALKLYQHVIKLQTAGLENSLFC
ncbi:hypothetical protein KUTeg_016267 [Tegillarca granosa]|uniref:Uncharacterized protein n=1 Tax=Tegillarca granosa TaxID=220873 RepID=A0ABQ9EKD2_TEGGR|nr:hypothetical protein KUTeg_016267 [Tegillarca granosa]